MIQALICRSQILEFKKEKRKGEKIALSNICSGIDSQMKGEISSKENCFTHNVKKETM